MIFIASHQDQSPDNSYVVFNALPHIYTSQGYPYAHIHMH